MHAAVIVEGVSKRFLLGERVRYHTLMDSLALRFRRRAGSSQAEEVWALRDVSFQVAQGEVLGVVGRNGAGKSTLLKTLARITRPTLGRIRLRGRVASLLEVGTGFHAELTGRENIHLNASILGMTQQEVRREFDRIVEFAGVERFLDTPVKRYSSGMHMRLAFAVAAHLRPEILLVDEVLAVGDLEFQRKCIGRMEEVARDGRTVLVVSHSMATVRALCSRALLLERGHVRTAGSAAEVTHEYMSSAGGSEASVVVDRSMCPVRTDRVELEAVELLNAVAGRFAVHWREAITLRATVRVREPVVGLWLGAGLRGLDGTHLFHVHHDDQGTQPLWDLSPGLYEIDFTMENPLRPGFYKVHLGFALDRHASRLLLQAEPAVLEVLDHGPDGTYPVAANTGLVNALSEWGEPRRIGD